MARAVWNDLTLKKPIERAQKKLIAVGFEMERRIKLSMKAGGTSLPGEPPSIRTGRLRASISTNWTGSGLAFGVVDGSAFPVDGIKAPKGSEFHVYVGTSVPYAVPLEYGTIKMAERPFMRPAILLFKNKSFLNGLMRSK